MNMTNIEFHPGRLPNDPEKPRLRAGKFFTAVPTYPDSLDYLSRVEKYPMYLNDQIGDCTCAATGHILEAVSTYGQGTTIKVTNNDVLQAYIAVSGYDPRTGDNDDGAVLQDVLNYWRKTGLGGHKILAFAEIDASNEAEVKAAMNTFGHVYLGMDFPRSAGIQFNHGKPWDVVDGSPIEGGHAVHGGAYAADGGNYKVTTWGTIQEVTPRFWLKYIDEAWVVITQEWLNAQGKAPSGFDLYGLGEELAELTGGENPFPAPPPTPTPDPTPTPTPTPSDPDEVLETQLTNWFNKGHKLPGHPHLEKVLKAWLQSRK